MLNIVIFGAPGSGKGTQSEILIRNRGLFHISTGDVLRDNIRRGTELGATAKAYIEQGQLIPDELMVSILADVLDANREAATQGVIFDGFPRTIAQAEALEDMLGERGTSVTLVLGLEVPEEEASRRVSQPDLATQGILQRARTLSRHRGNGRHRGRGTAHRRRTEPLLIFPT